MPSVIKPGVKAESRKKLIERWKAYAAKDSAKAARDAKALGVKLEAAQKKVRAAFLGELDSNRSTRTIRKELASIDKAVQSLVKRPATTSAQRRAVEKELKKFRVRVDAIESAHRSAVTEAYQRAVKPDSYRTAMLKALKRSGRRIEMKDLRYSGSWFSMIHESLEHIDWTSLSHPQNSFTLEPSYDDDATVSEEFKALFGLAEATHDANVGTVDLDTFASVAGYMMARAQFGAFLTIPSGFEKLKLQARIVDISARVTAWAVVGGSWASSGTIAEVTDVASNTTRRVEASINYVAAPLLFLAVDTFEGPSILNAEFEVPHEGGEILVTAGLKCDVWAALPSATQTLATGRVEKITVELE